MRWRQLRCPECSNDVETRIAEGISVSFRSGSVEVADLYSRGFAECTIVSERLLLALKDGGITGFLARPVVVVEPEKYRRPRNRLMIKYPYDGPQLYELFFPETVDPILEECPVELTGYCDACGNPKYDRTDFRNDADKFVFERNNETAVDMFRTFLIGKLFVTEPVCDIIENGNFKNIKMRQWGEIRQRKLPVTLPLPRPISAETVPPREPYDPSRGYPALDWGPSLPELDLKRNEYMQDLLEYLHLEDDEDLEADDLEYVRSAMKDGHRYWVWQYLDDVGEISFASVQCYPENKGIALSCDDGYFGRTPEQYLDAEHYER